MSSPFYEVAIILVHLLIYLFFTEITQLFPVAITAFYIAASITPNCLFIFPLINIHYYLLS